MIPQIPVEVYDKIVDLCKKHKVRQLSLFGSRVRGDHSGEKRLRLPCGFST